MHCSWCARYDLFAVALPPLRPAAFFCAVVPPCDELLREELDEPDFLPPRPDEPEEFEIFAARSFDMPLSFSASYCFSFLTLLLLLGMHGNFPCVRENHLCERQYSATWQRRRHTVRGARRSACRSGRNRSRRV